MIWWFIISAITVIPFWRLLPRFGIPAPVALVAIIPLGALVLLYIMAFKDDSGRSV